MTNSFKPYLLWNSDERAEIHSIEDLDQLIERLIISAKVKMPFSVQLLVNAETGLLITLGREESHMEFYSAASKPPISGCRGPWDDDTLIAFLFGGEYSEIERRYCVPLTDAREALRQYFQTGVRPSIIQWNDGFISE